MIILDILQAFNTLHMQNTHLVVRIIYKFKINKKKSIFPLKFSHMIRLKILQAFSILCMQKNGLNFIEILFFLFLFISKETFIARRLLHVLFFFIRLIYVHLT